MGVRSSGSRPLMMAATIANSNRTEFMPIHPSTFGSVPVVTWINAGERHIRVFQLVVDAKDWVARLHSMDHISEVEILNALVHVPEAETAGSR